jgi:hypothetical protein
LTIYHPDKNRFDKNDTPEKRADKEKAQETFGKLSNAKEICNKIIELRVVSDPSRIYFKN